VGYQRVDFRRAFAFEQFRGARDRVGGVCEVVDEDAGFARDGADEEQSAVGVDGGGVGVASFLGRVGC
jgi:hypothetical protein